MLNNKSIKPISVKPFNGNININNNILNNHTINSVKITDFAPHNVETVSFEINPIVIPDYLKIKDDLNSVSVSDTQINNTNLFSNYTDFQNVAFANFSFLELFYSGNLESLSGKTINELFMESCGTGLNNYSIDDYKNFYLTDDVLLLLLEQSEKDKNRTLFLGKLITYGFGDLKIDKVVTGDNGFDAIVFVDQEGNYMIHFSCTDIYESSDLLHDTKPILDKLGIDANPTLLNGAFSSLNPKQIYDSQKAQALAFLESYLENKNIDKVNISGFSLGGALAEYAYFSKYGQNDKLGDLLLYNPGSYQVDIDKDKFVDAYNNGKVKRYASEGDIASTIFGGEFYNEYTKPVYIDYESVVEKGKMRTSSDDSIINIWLANAIKKYSGVSTNIKFNEYINKIHDWLKENEDLVHLLSIKTRKDIDIDFIGSLNEIPTVLTGIHMPYSAEINKNTSFDKNGALVTEVNGREVTYPTFEEMSNTLFGYNIADTVINNVYMIRTESEEELVNHYFGDMYDLSIGYKNVEKIVFQNYLKGKINAFKVNVREEFQAILDDVSIKLTGCNIEELNSEIKDIVYNVNDRATAIINDFSTKVLGVNINELRENLIGLVYVVNNQ